jgi:uroporphyrinogen-III decarboxylase
VQEAARLGAAGVWIEECLTDMVSPEAFARLNVPYLQRIVKEIRHQGMKSIYYYCGNPEGKWEHLFAVGADALSLEEGKKGWSVNIDEIVERAGGRCAVLGNLDAINFLPNASEEQMAKEISRQVAAGHKNGGRFVMSTGSPITPGTPMAKVRQYCDLVHKLGAAQ